MKKYVCLIVCCWAVGLVGAAQGAPGEAATPEPTETKKENTVAVTIKTSMGDIKLELDQAKAPVTVENFIQYAKAGHYKGTVFHRVIDGFMIQGGGMTADMKQKPTRPSIKNEASNGLKNLKGTVAMARTSDVNSATSQFFINVKDNAFLDHRDSSPQGFGYCVFGHVTGGEDVVEKMKAVKTANKGMHQDVPVESIEILEVIIDE